jgi:hypothetical protein
MLLTLRPRSALRLASTLLFLSATSASAHFTEISEGFAAVVPAGWLALNLSAPEGSTTVFQGDSGTFAAQAGAATSYGAMDSNATTGTNTISVWLITPGLVLGNGSELSFYTRTVSSPEHPDRVELRLSFDGACDPGSGAESVGDFTKLLLTVNPNLLDTGYPSTWTKFSATISGLPDGHSSGCAAFRYFVTNGGPTGANSDYVGIDTVEFRSVFLFADDFEEANLCDWSQVVGGGSC